MSEPSLKVPRQVQDRLAAAARARGITVRALLDEMSVAAADAALLEQAREQMLRMREVDPEGWADYVHEGEEWEAGTVEHPDT
jgi:hypothetical protein